MSASESCQVSMSSVKDNDHSDDEFTLKYKKKIRQLEREHTIEKALLEQKIELLEVKLREFEEREEVLKKMNSDIMVTLSDLNHKEDSSLMHKVSEELALANKEKLREKKQQKSKFEALKHQLEINIGELKNKLEESERKRKELELDYQKDRLNYERDIEQERKSIAILKKELEELRHRAKEGGELDRFKKKALVLEEENNNLKNEFEKEINRMRFEFDRNLSELKDIHNEERASFESRLKKTKEMLTKSEEENEAKTQNEGQLTQEISSLRERLSEMECAYSKKLEDLTNERDNALQKAKELEKRVEELTVQNSKQQQNEYYSEGLTQTLVEGLASLDDNDRSEQNARKTVNQEPPTQKIPCEQPSIEQTMTFTNLGSNITSLACSMIHDPFYPEHKKSSVPQSQALVTEPTQSSWSERNKKLANPKAMKSVSKQDLSCYSNSHHQVSSSSGCTNDFESQKSAVRSMSNFSEKGSYMGRVEQKLCSVPSKQTFDKSSIDYVQLSVASDLNVHEYPSVKEWVLKDTSQGRANYADQGCIKRQIAIGQQEGLHISYINENGINPDFSLYKVKENRTHDPNRSASNRGLEKGMPNSRMQINYLDQPQNSIDERMPMLVRSGSRCLLGTPTNPELNDKFDDWRASYVEIKEEDSSDEAKGKIFRKGIQEVMNGLHNIKNRLERQQENILIAKSETYKQAATRTRSFSNARLRPTPSNQESLHANSFHNDANYRLHDYSSVFPQSNNELKRSVYLTEEPSIHGITSSSYLAERDTQSHNRYAYASHQINYRKRAPMLLRENNRTCFKGHRNSLA